MKGGNPNRDAKGPDEPAGSGARRLHRAPALHRDGPPYARPSRDLPLFMALAPFSEPDTSAAAARAIEPELPRLEALVLGEIRTAGDRGACCHELEEATGLPHTTCSARVRGLVLKGLVEDSGLRRKTPAGRAAKAWRTVGPAADGPAE